MKQILISIIKVYQKTLSPDHGWFRARWPYGYCRYYPSCSQYSIEAISMNGVVKGVWQSIKRIVRCNPFASSGADPVTKV